ncbi:CLUMA_CG018042, isoform A [Clunio marinus]|uniref:CLUMA_CG018042, isoform A n=1 Tax=Clunio marinus TaxID=568069 RepID=A0A1J1J0R2_9DIPT|nr:CLUMA_CG018042, isoform A [Clunio marinus]
MGTLTKLFAALSISRQLMKTSTTLGVISQFQRSHKFVVIPEPGKGHKQFRRIVHYPKDGKYTVKPLDNTHLAGRDPVTGRKVVQGLGGGVKHKFHWIKYERDGPSGEGEVQLEKVLDIIKCGCRTAHVALVGVGDELKYILATENMKPGDILKTSKFIPRIPVRANEGDAFPLGALPIGTKVHSIQAHPGEMRHYVTAAGTFGTILRKIDDRIVIQLPTKKEYGFLQNCMATVGRLSNVEHSSIHLGTPQRLRELGYRPRSGWWQRKSGRHGRKIKRLPPMRLIQPAKIENNPGWPEKICLQCVHQVSRCHSFKKRIEKSDEQLKQYIKSLTVVVEDPTMKEMRVPEVKQQPIQQQQQPQIQEIQIQRPETHPLIIANVLNNPSTMLNSGQQLIQTPNGQIIQAQIGQFIQGPNNTIQMITTNPTNVAPQPQLLHLRQEPENRCELIVQPSEMSEPHYFEEIPVVVQSANGQQTILNLPHHQVQALQQQIAQSANNNQHHQHQQQLQLHQHLTNTVASQNTCTSEPDEIEIHEVQEYEDFGCDDMEEIVNEDDQEPETTQTTYIVQTIQEESSENSDSDDKQLLAEFLAQQTHSEPGKHKCNLCNQEFKHHKWLHSHMKSIHINWIKANCKKQPQCTICGKSFRGPGMLKMHMKTHEKENKLPTCSICSKEFKSKSILYRHRATHFSNQRQFKCNICDKNFSSNYQLNAHIQRHQKNHQCAHCEKNFSNASDLKLENKSRMGAASKLIHRKTSAEIVSEARNSLMAGGSVRLVSTRRPITPNVNKRQLYGKDGPAGRPPSAFNLKYLQYETRALPCLEPISQMAEELHKKIERSGSLGTIYESNLKTKLPALVESPRETVAGSLENCNWRALTKIDYFLVVFPFCGVPSAVRESMPLKKGSSVSLPDGTIDINEHTLKRKQPSSFDDKTFSDVIDVKNDDKTTNDFVRNRLIRSNDLLTQTSTEVLLDLLKEYSGVKECSEETQTHLYMILLELYSRVKETKGSWRSAILGALYGLVECNSPKILLAVARVVLALGVTGSNLTGACKLVFKVARNEVNDSLFIDSDVPELLVEALGKVTPTADGDPEAAIYGYGAIRFLATANSNTLSKKTENPESKTIKVSKHKSLAYRLVKHGIIQLMIVHLQILNEFGSTAKLSGQPLHALYQLSGALRTLSGSPIFAQIINMRHSRASSIDEEDTHLEIAGKHLVRAAEICMDEIEVQTNIIRTLSILSDIESCCEFMSSDAGRLGILFGAIGINYGSGMPEKPLAVISRLGYILGNIFARYDDARLEFFNNDASMEYVLSTLEFYSNQRFDIKNNNGDTVMDALIKLIRVIANMSVNAEVGYGLGLRPPLGVVLLNILLEAKEIKSDEAMELVLATLAALHNLSYYQNTSDETMINHPGSIVERTKDISVTLCQILDWGPQLAKNEAARVLGNLTRNSMARQSFCAANGLKVLVKCLQSDDGELVETSCGVLVNLLGDWERRQPFKELKGIRLLIDILQKAATDGNWLLTGIVCQAFWNFVIDSSNVIDSLGDKEADILARDLADYLDEERIFEGNLPDPMWEQFAQVATDLLERLQSCMSLNSTPVGSFDYGDDDVDLARNSSTYK